VTERERHPQAAVVRRGAADAEQDALRAELVRGPQEFAGAAGAGGRRVERPVGDERQAAGRAHLQDRPTFGGNPAEASGPRSAERVGDGRLGPDAAQRVHHRLGGPLAAVGDGTGIELGPREDLGEGMAQGRRHLRGGEGALELVAGEEDTHPNRGLMHGKEGAGKGI